MAKKTTGKGKTYFGKRLSKRERERKRMGELKDILRDLFHPFVKRLVRSAVEKEMANMPEVIKVIKKEIKKEGLFFPEGLSAEGREAFRQKMEKILDDPNPQPLSREETDNMVEEEAEMTTILLVDIWLNALSLSSESRVIYLKTIDDAMLPGLNEDVDQAFNQSFAQSFLSAEQAHEVLRQVRASLPPGKILPDQAIDFLTLAGVEIVS